MPRKSPDTGISLHGVPFPSKGNVVCSGGGGSFTGDFDRRMKEGSSGGAYVCEGFREGDFAEVSFTGEPES